jgi:hypothetical protein
MGVRVVHFFVTRIFDFNYFLSWSNDRSNGGAWRERRVQRRVKFAIASTDGGEVPGEYFVYDPTVRQSVVDTSNQVAMHHIVGTFDSIS